MKPYIPEKLAAISRYQNYIPILFAPKPCARAASSATSALCGMKRTRAMAGNAARAFKKKEGSTWDCFRIM